MSRPGSSVDSSVPRSHCPGFSQASDTQSLSPTKCHAEMKKKLPRKTVWMCSFAVPLNKQK